VRPPPGPSTGAGRHGRRPPGCAGPALAAPLLAVLAPAAAVVRGWQAWRRGSALRVEIGRGSDPAIELTADIPSRSGSVFPRRLTHALVRVAETLRAADDTHHLVYRIPGDDEATLVPVGPRLQELGERLRLVLAQAELERRTALWLTLPAHQAIGEVIDPRRDDPEADGEPGDLVARTGARWAAATAWTRSGPSTVYRVLLWVPEASVDAVEGILRSVGE
jgi:hypothetical protein